jgi:antitoxin ParD1/3/4
MTRQLTAKHEALVEQIVASGRYESADQVLDEALHLLQEREERRQWLRQELQKGFDQAERGELIEFTAEYREEILRRAIQSARLNKPVRDAVKP